MSTHEGGIRVPCFVRWPKHIPAGILRPEVATVMDLTPTFIEAAGLEPHPDHELHGVSILPLLQNKSYQRSTPIHWETDNIFGVLPGEWKLVNRFWEDGPRLYHLSEDQAQVAHPVTFQTLLPLNVIIQVARRTIHPMPPERIALQISSINDAKSLPHPDLLRILEMQKWNSKSGTVEGQSGVDNSGRTLIGGKLSLGAYPSEVQMGNIG